MDIKNLLLRIDAEMHKEIRLIAVGQGINIQKLFERHGFKEFVGRIIEEEKNKGK